MSLDPTRALTERSPDEIGEYLDDHLVMALQAAEMLTSDRQTAEDLVRDRLVAMSDTYRTRDDLTAEERRRRLDRMRAAVKYRETS